LGVQLHNVVYSCTAPSCILNYLQI